MSDFSPQDCAHMARALRLAAKGRFSAHPNPMVGCVIAKESDILGEGWHRKAGESHAEVNALQNAGNDASGATAYVTLEPCSHEGRTPPCASALIAAGIARVVVAMEDPFPAVSGSGIAALRAAGISVDVGLMALEAQALNRGFLSRVTRKRPFVQLKLASSLDGAIAMANGESQWVTSPQARDDVQRLRAMSGAILTGIGTVLSDDPALTVRMSSLPDDYVQPLRVVLDSSLRMPTGARMLTLSGETLVCHDGSQADAHLRDTGARTETFAASDGRIDVLAVLQYLAAREINGVLLECGPTLAGHFLQAELVDELVIYQAPHIMGSETMRLANTPGWQSLTDRLELNVIDTRQIGADTRITARPAN